MPGNSKTLLCSYSYDPLNRLVANTSKTQADTQRFYSHDRLATEIQAGLQHSILQYNDQPLAQQLHRNGAVNARLLATDQQRSVAHVLEAILRPLAYSPYGHRPVENGLLGFNGEWPSPETGWYLLGNGYRAFNPVLMRFHCPDSLSPFGKGGLNAYAYCWGDPVNRRDPSGHFPMPAALRSLLQRVFGRSRTERATPGAARTSVSSQTSRRESAQSASSLGSNSETSEPRLPQSSNNAPQLPGYEESQSHKLVLTPIDGRPPRHDDLMNHDPELFWAKMRPYHEGLLEAYTVQRNGLLKRIANNNTKPIPPTLKREVKLLNKRINFLNKLIRTQ